MCSIRCVDPRPSAVSSLDHPTCQRVSSPCSSITPILVIQRIVPEAQGAFRCRDKIVKSPVRLPDHENDYARALEKGTVTSTRPPSWTSASYFNAWWLSCSDMASRSLWIAVDLHFDYRKSGGKIKPNAPDATCGNSELAPLHSRPRSRRAWGSLIPNPFLPTSS